MEYPTVSRDPKRQARYEEMRRAGESHNIAELLAIGRFPYFMSDDIFIKGRFCSDRDKNGEDEIRRRRKAEAAGVSTNGKEYFSGLADFPDDPTAWAGSRDEVREIAKRKGMTVHGMVEYRPPQVEPAPEEPYTVAPDLIEAELSEKMSLADRMSSDYEREQEKTRDYLTRLRSGLLDPNPPKVKDYEVDAFAEE